MADRIGTLVILGASGDLTKRLLLPGLGELLDSGKGGELELLGVGQGALTDEGWRERVSASFASGKVTGARSSAVAHSTRYLQADVTKPDDLRRVLAACHGTPALYFALPPRVTIAACSALSSVDLPEGTVFGLEKPFGTDLESAQALNRQLLTLVPEQDIHRIDHFLGKATVLNLLGLRFANRVFEQMWNADNIERVEIVFDEQLALEGRAGYYDRAGALIDMIQSHLLLVLALVAMEPPSSIDADDLRGSIAQLLRATEAWGGDPTGASRRARYTAGTIGERSIPAYVDEKGVDTKRETETLVELTLAVQNWRWAGVPFVLRSGKALARSRQEIVVTFKDVPHLPTGLSGKLAPAQLRISLSPAGVSLDLNINGERDPFTLERVSVDAEFAPGAYMPYGEILAGILSADPTLSVRDDAVEQCWRIVTPILEAWKAGAVPLENYPAGSEGPTSW
ncbi:glucose-6-phosphate dehydrogenase [Parafrigoribacterium humi]|jgi:glucose-6-phosphate 1-dehydrogenase|uniref:glucose-6-phosphate dehydrogenase n=1 Tax=Parafrigoribacterium humi TaxID=3144664 RepID=UPI0032ED01A4